MSTRTTRSKSERVWRRNHITQWLVVLSLFVTGCGSSSATPDQTCETEPGPSGEREDCLINDDRSLSYTSVSGLKSLCNKECTRAESLTINLTDDVVNLKMLQHVKTIDGTLSLFKNADLKSLRGLGATDIGTLKITDNDELESLEGIKQEVGTVRRVEMLGNESLNTLEGIGAIDTLENLWFLSGNANSLEDLANVEFPEDGAVLIDDQDGRLANLKGLGHVERLSTLSIDNVKNLESLEGLGSLQKVTRTLVIENNPNLPSCLAEQLVSRVDTSEAYNVEIRGNGGYDYPECESETK